MECLDVGGVVVCREELREVRRDQDGAPRWCFRCRACRVFQYVVRAPVGPSYYGPNPGIECGTCGTSDGDLFPGRTREWDE